METYSYDTNRRSESSEKDQRDWLSPYSYDSSGSTIRCLEPSQGCRPNMIHDAGRTGDPIPDDVADPIGGCRTNFTYDPGPHPAASEPASAPPILTSDYPACVGNMMYDAYRPPAPAGDKASDLAEFAALVACVTGGACDSSLAADEPIIVPVRTAAREE